MEESKVVTMDRLRQEGRWEEASLYKDTVIKRLRAEGMGKVEAGEAGWAAVRDKYPPLPVEPQAEDKVIEDLDALLERFEGNSTNLAGDTLWVYQNLENKQVKPEDAPSLGAWSLLKWAREYRNRFFEQILPKAMPKGSSATDDRERRIREEEMKSVEEIRGMLAELDVDGWIRDQGWVRPGEVACVKETRKQIKRRVRDLLAEWGQLNQVSLKPAANKALEAKIMHFVCGYTRGATHPEKVPI